MTLGAATATRHAWLARTFKHAAVLTGLIFAVYLFFVAAPFKGSMGFDVVSYWRLDLAQPYHGTVGDLGFFPYSPAVALLFAPFADLPWLAFAVLWYGVLVAALTFMGGRSTLVLLAFPPVAIDLYHGNIHLLIAAGVVVAMRYQPAAWAFVILTKATPGIGLLWYAVRREWRNLAIALGATGTVVVVTFLVLPNQWITWLGIIVNGAGTPPPWPALPIPIWLRLPVAAALIIWGARKDKPWTVAAAVAISVPALWPGSFSILAAAWALRSRPPAAATASHETHGYHAPDAPHSRGGRRAEPASA
jgi:hypothetical protein